MAVLRTPSLRTCLNSKIETPEQCVKSVCCYAALHEDSV